MDNIRAYRSDDIAQIVDLHRRAHWPNHAPRDPIMLERFYTKLLSGNPWRDEQLPSLVVEDDAGRIVGFMGRVPRPMTFGERRIMAAVASRLMVDPDHKSPFAAFELVRTFLSGPQDLSYSDGATEAVRRIWELAGGSSIPALSFKWTKILRPCLVALSQRMGKLPAVVTATCRGADSLASRLSVFRVPRVETTGREIGAVELLGHIADTASAYALHPIYEVRTLRWLLEFTKGDEHWGPIRCTAVDRSGSGTVGWFVHIPRPGRVSEVLALGFRSGFHAIVLRHLIYTARHEGAAAVQGRPLPNLLDDYWAQGCLGKRGPWAIAHARDPRILTAVATGNAFLSCLEGELWMPPTS